MESRDHKNEVTSRRRLRRLQEISMRDVLVVGLPALLLISMVAVLLMQYVRPAPPTKLVISTGAEGAAYQRYAARYKEILAQYNVEIIEQPSQGSIENLQRLRDSEHTVDAGFVQGGTTLPEDSGLRSLGNLYYEPLWIFIRDGVKVDLLDQLKGHRIAIGQAGSGTYRLANNLLQAHGLVDGEQGTHLLPLGALDAMQALMEGQADAAFIVGTAQSAAVWTLLYTRGVHLLDMSRADAYARRFSYLHVLTLPRGSIDLQRDIPAHDVRLLAPMASLVVHPDTHPAHIDLLLNAMQQVHREAGVFEQTGEFPSGRNTELPLQDRAARWYQSGPPFLQRYMPFWLATLLDRLWVVLIPLLALLWPLWRLLPPLYSWRVRARLYRWYGELKYLESDAERNPSSRSAEEWHQALDRIERAVNRVSTPLAFADYLYQLRSHIDLVRTQFVRRFGTPEHTEPATSNPANEHGPAK